MPETADIEALFEKYHHKVYRLAIRISRTPSDAQDITQETFLKVMKNLKYFRNMSKLSTWIYRIAYNEALMNLRKRRSQFRLSGYLKKVSSGPFMNRPLLPDKVLLEGELKERIDRAIRKLPIKYRMPLLLDTAKRSAPQERLNALTCLLN